MYARLIIQRSPKKNTSNILSNFIKPAVTIHTTTECQSRKDDAPLPESFDTLQSQQVQFSLNRTRDFTGQAMEIQDQQQELTSFANKLHQAVPPPDVSDSHTETYDSHGNISLNAVMQTMVPEPYSTNGKKAPTHLNMPGGHMQQGQKYLSGDLQDVHYNHQHVRKLSTLSNCRQVD